MAAAVRTLKTVRPHIPMIKFPKRGGVPAYDATASAAASKASDSKPVGSMPRGSGIEPEALPKKYQRKLLTTEEMEYIERGGPA